MAYGKHCSVTIRLSSEKEAERRAPSGACHTGKTARKQPFCGVLHSDPAVVGRKSGSPKMTNADICTTENSLCSGLRVYARCTTTVLSARIRHALTASPCSVPVKKEVKSKNQDEKKPLRSDSGFFFIRPQSRFACVTSVRILFVPDWFPAIF